MSAIEPRGFVGVTACLGLKEAADDFTVVAAPSGATTSAAVFTQSLFAGPSVVVSREADRSRLRGIVVVSKNANVATGEEGRANALELRERAAALVGCAAEEILVASTGVIGVQYPMPTMRAALDAIDTPLAAARFADSAAAIMTTDTHPKVAAARCGAGTIVGIAKGVGMIEPNMATMLAFFFTDVAVPADALDEVFRRVVAKTFNAVSIDSDTSTSDTAAIISSGAAGPADLGEFEATLEDCALQLVKAIARDGEGATKLIEVRVLGARDDAQAKRVAKSVVNSPLVKTAVHGADPNWGRVAMAIGKCESETDIDPERVRIAFGGMEVYPNRAESLERLGEYLRGDTCLIEAHLGIANGTFTAYGCDLTEGYVRLNADYTT